MSNSTKTALPPAKVPASVWENGVELTEEEIEAAKAELIEDDGEPLETPWHRAEINLLIDSVVWHRRGRTDFFPGGNMFVYFSRKQNKGHFYKGPDFFLVNNVDGTVERKYWWVFEEDGRFPDIIIELLSPTTADEDRTTKKKLYEKTFRTPEYFCYDPDEKKLQGWKLVNSRYQKLTANDKGWLWSEELGFWLGLWEGFYLGKKDVWLRFFDKDGNLVETETEFQRRRAETAEKLVEQEKQRADALEQRAEQEKQRADALGVEIARLKVKSKNKNK